MQYAADEFEKGNIRGVLVDIRNAVPNYLTQVVNVKNKKKAVLNIAFLAGAPTNARNIYKNIIDNLQNELLAALETIHKFVHEDCDILKMTAMRDDLELTHYSVALIALITSNLARINKTTLWYSSIIVMLRLYS
ncbi:MAG TPA: hypothetical protein VIP70_05985 [Nitrososphaeraceae archaeon]